MTTSPKRIQKIQHVIDTLDLEDGEKLLLTLPRKFSRSGESYTIPESIRRNPKVQIVWIEEDLGPISKIVPALEYAKKKDPGSIVISVDDDIAYPPGMKKEFIYHLARSRNTVFSSVTMAVDHYNIHRADWKFPHDSGVLPIGAAAIGYRSGEIDTGLLRKLSGLSRDTFGSDDLVIGYALAASRIKRARIDTPYFNPRQLVHLPHGFEEDALHRGAGLQVTDPGLVDQNAPKYQRAIQQLNAALKPPRGAYPREGWQGLVPRRGRPAQQNGRPGTGSKPMTPHYRGVRVGPKPRP